MLFVDRFWHRIGVYWGLRDDAALEASWKTNRPDALTRLVGFMLGVIVLLAGSALIVLVARAVFGGDTSAGSVVWGGLQLLWLLMVVGALGAAAVRWGRRLAGRASDQ